MFKALRLSDHPVSAARRHDLLRGKKLIGRGVFSAVFDNGETVLKLTLDRFAHMLACDGTAPSGQHFAGGAKDHGELGEVHGNALRLFEVEKLERLPNEGPLRSLGRLITNGVKTSRIRQRGRQVAEQVDQMTLRELSQNETLPPSLRHAFERLRVFYTNVASEGCRLDIHSANLMVRQSDQSLVLSDPLMDHTVLWDIEQKRMNEHRRQMLLQ